MIHKFSLPFESDFILSKILTPNMKYGREKVNKKESNNTTININNRINPNLEQPNQQANPHKNRRITHLPQGNPALGCFLNPKNAE